VLHPGALGTGLAGRLGTGVVTRVGGAALGTGLVLPTADGGTGAAEPPPATVVAVGAPTPVVPAPPAA
jgi:hypothetical protein